MTLTDAWLATAAEITGKFETMSSNPWAAATGDFDQMGISCGVLQWNIGMGSLQPMVKSVGKAVVKHYMPSFGEKMWQAANAPVKDGLKIVRQWQTGTTLKPSAKAELSALFGGPEMKAVQLARVRTVGESAFALAEVWCKNTGAPMRLKDFCWFFDLVTQNGSLKNLTFKDAQDLIDAHTPDRVDDVICGWLNKPASNAWQGEMAKRNAGLWRNAVASADLPLFALSYLRSLKAVPRALWLVMNRKGILTVGKGWLNGSQFDLTGNF